VAVDGRRLGCFAGYEMVYHVLNLTSHQVRGHADHPASAKSQHG
jgi:hypothetical protein